MREQRIFVADDKKKGFTAGELLNILQDFIDSGNNPDATVEAVVSMSSKIKKLTITGTDGKPKKAGQGWMRMLEE